MKKLTKLLALTLCAIMTMSFAALAEPAPSTVNAIHFQVSDPVVTINGQPIFNLTGLTLDTSLSYTDMVNMAIDVGSGDKSAVNIKMSIDGEKLLIGADGIPTTYGVDISGFTGGLTLEALADALMKQLFATLEKIGMYAADVYKAYSSGMTQGEPYTSTLEDGTPVTYDVTHFEYDDEFIDGRLDKFTQALGGSSLLALAKRSMQFTGFDMSSVKSVVDEAKNAVYALEGDFYYDSEGGNMLYVANSQASYNEQTVDVVIHADYFPKADGANGSFSITMTPSEGAAYEVNGYINIAEYEDGEGLEAAVTVTSDSDDEPLYQAALSFAPASVNGEYAELVMNAVKGSEKAVSMAMQAYAPTAEDPQKHVFMNILLSEDEQVVMVSEVYATMGMDDEGNIVNSLVINSADEQVSYAMGFNFEGKLTDDGLTGTLAIGAGPEEQFFEAQANIATYNEIANVADVELSADSYVNLLNMTDNDRSALYMQGMSIAMNSVGVLASGVPGIASILGGLLGM